MQVLWMKVTEILPFQPAIPIYFLTADQALVP